ncbi:MAG: FG-GAP repeat protein [Deltaproteobacteria bacterium]|nr:FG-GAP repeat protein [Deltaproteobacteria bacterium]
MTKGRLAVGVVVWGAVCGCSVMGFFDESPGGASRACDPGETRALDEACGLCSAGTAQQRCSPAGEWATVGCDDRVDVDGDGYANALCGELADGCCVAVRDCDDGNPDVHPEGAACATTTVACTTTCGSTGAATCTAECLPPPAAACAPPAESCNGADDDCDGAADDGFACVRNDTMSCSTSCGSIGTGRCSDACAAPAVEECGTPAESCNGADDDCDAEIDEDLPCVQGMTVDCTASCGTTGRGACTASCAVPGPAACTPPAEDCNNLVDDDCDGETDELDARQCAPGTTVACETACGSAGSGTCTDGCVPPSGAACVPPAETCNGEDDDCDGGTDEDWPCAAGSAVACTTSCGSSGTGACSAACALPGPGECVAPAETCNGLDDDCDGAPDDGFACIQGALVPCATVCSTAGYGPCSATCGFPAAVDCTASEACNGADDDCDGAPDDGFACVAGSADVACTSACGTGGSRSCTFLCALGPCLAPEICNGCDDDGDTACDDGAGICCQGVALPCTVAGCGTAGTQTCLPTCAGWTTCSAAETCNACDDDLDTVPDDDFACVRGATRTCAVATCPGTQSCVAGTCDWSACELLMEPPTVPVLLAPENGERTGSVHAPAARNTLRPAFRWQAASAACGALTYELQVDDSCTTPGFATCTFASPEVAVSAGAAPTYRPTADLPVSTSVPVGRRYYWRVRACDVGGRCGGWSAVRYLDVGRLPGDINGDGRSDVLTGAPLNDAEGMDAGRVYVFLGGIVPDAVADLVLTGEAAGDQLGLSLAEAGDINADGFADLVVGAPHNAGGGADAGRAYVHFGAAAPDPAADWVLSGAAGARMGTSVDGAGDVNGDGFADLIVGSPGPTYGRVDIFRGAAAPDTTPDTSLSGGSGPVECPPESGGFEDVWTAVGSVVAAAGHVNGDGLADVFWAVAFGGSTCVGNGGVVDGLGSSLGGPWPADAFGRAFSGVGDVNADGYGDVVIGVPQTLSDRGRAYLYRGAASLDWTADYQFDGAAAGDLLGWSVAGAGDFNGLAGTEYVVGSPGADGSGSGAGNATVWASTGLWVTLAGAAAGDAFGSAVGGDGIDVNGDGFADVLVGAPASDAAGSDSGRAYLFLGGSVADSAADLTLSGAAAGDRFGTAVDG